MNGIIVKLENVNGKQVPAVTSQQLAEVFGKEHYNVLRDIRETVAKCSKSFCALNFEGAEYLDEQGKSRPMYLMTKDGFTMVAMAYTTPGAMRFKEAYIAEFNRMEAELQRGTQQSLPEFPAKIEAAAIILRVAGITGNQAMHQRYQLIAGDVASIELVILFHHDPQTNAEHDDMKMQIITSDVRNTKFFSLIADILLLPGCGRYDGTHINCEPQLGECGGVEDHAAHVGRRQCLEASGQRHNLNGASDAFLGEFLLHHLG